MADPITVLGIVNSLAQTANLCFQIIRGVCSAPDEIRDLNAEAANWRPQLEGLAELMDGDSNTAIRLRKKLEDGGLIEVRNLVEALNNVLKPWQKPSRLRQFKWATSTTKDEVKELLSQLQRNMALIMNHVQMEIPIALEGIDDGIRKIREIQESELDEHERRIILEYFRPRGIDAKEFHRQKRALRQKGTCDWLVDSTPWKDWCEGGSATYSRLLWIHGLAGAGKTVLASKAIDDVLSKYQHKGVSYYYCSHERQKQGYTSADEACSFLRWVIGDLTNQVTRPTTGTSNRQAKIPQALKDSYDKHDLTSQNLLDCLLDVTVYIAKGLRQQVCIVVDAVDECPTPREALLNVLTTIGTDPDWQHVSLCFTSRNETDISDAIKAVQPSQPTRPETPLRSGTPSPSRVILTPQGPSGVLQRRGISCPSSHVSGFDGRPRHINEMGPPPRPYAQEENVRGRSPAIHLSPFPNATQRPSRSINSRQQASGMSLHGSGLERSSLPRQDVESRDVDPMEIDSLDYPISGINRKAGCTILSMDDNPDVMRAIRAFVRSQLKGDGTVNESLEKVIDLIAQKARGMFRWAACQVDIIIRSNLRDMDSISEMLDTIPSDIFGTYQHMIMKLLPNGQGQNEHNRNFARTALALICSETSEVPCAKVLIEASRFNVPHGSAHRFNLDQLQKILGCLIKVTFTRTPTSMYSRNVQEDTDVTSQVSVAHYTVKEYLFHKSTAVGPVKEFALSTQAIQSLELLVIFSGLQQFGRNRPVEARSPTRYEEYCLTKTDKALSERRDHIVRDKTVWKAVTECLRWNSNHHLPRSGAFPNMKIRTTLSSWAKTSPFEQTQEPTHEETSVLVSLLLLQWPELATVYLADLPEAKRRDIWRDKFQLAKSFRVEGTEPTSLLQMCVTRRDIAFLQVLSDSRADFSRQRDLVMDLFYHAYGHRSLHDEDAGQKTGRMLKMLLDRGVRPETRGYVFTPLQFAVSNLEEVWVDQLLHEFADPNAVGSTDGVHPFGAEDDDIPAHLPPLAICKQATPEWLKSDLDNDLIEDIRTRIAETLRRFGAVDNVTHPPRPPRPLYEDGVIVVDE